MSVLVTCGNLRSSLAVTRSLGKRGVPVTVGEAFGGSLAARSRFCQRQVIYPHPELDDRGFVTEMARRASQGEFTVIFPMDDITLWALSEARAQFEGLAVLPFPGVEAVQMAHDKAALLSLAASEHIPIPKTFAVRSASDVEEAIRSLDFPMVVKPRLSRFRREGHWVSGGPPRYVRTRKELEQACQEVERAVPLPLVQEYSPGEGCGIFLLVKQGEVRAAFAHRRIREKPPTGGVSVLSESVAMDPALLDYSTRLVRSLKWHGVAMVEFKRDARDGTTRLLEMNGRFWGSLQLAVDAGIDFPYLLYRLAVNGDVEGSFTYRKGIRLRWWLGDLDCLFLRMRGGANGRMRLRAIADFLRPLGRPGRAEVLRRDDPWPALQEAAEYVATIARRMPVRLLRGRRRA